MKNIGSVSHLLFYTIICIILPQIGFTQTQLQEEKRTYVDEEKNFFIQQSLPLYIQVSTSPDGEKFLLKNEAPPTFDNPITFDRSGVETISIPGKGKFKIHVDGIQPVTAITLLNAPKYTRRDMDYFGRGLTGDLLFRDEMSGVENTYISINGDSYKNYGGTLSFSQEGKYILLYYSSDKVGNIEAAKKTIFTVDLSAPSTNFVASGTKKGNILSPDVTFSLSSNDELAGVDQIYYSFNSAGINRFGSLPVSLRQLEDGEHTFVYYAIDKVSNKEVEKTYSFYLDKIPPLTNFQIIGDRYQSTKTYVSPRSKIKFASIDNKSGVDKIIYSINNGIEKPYETPFLLPLTSGDVRIKYYAIDQVSNTSKNKQTSLNLYYDDKAPELTSEYDGPTFFTRDTMFTSPETEVVINASDLASGVKETAYTLDNDMEQTYRSEEDLVVTEQGYHSLKFRSVDNVNNEETDVISFFVDATPPDIEAHYSTRRLGVKSIGNDELDIYPSHVILSLSASDFEVGSDLIYYSINGEAEVEYTRPIKNFESGEAIFILVRAIDKLGNTSTRKLRIFIE